MVGDGAGGWAEGSGTMNRMSELTTELAVRLEGMGYDSGQAVALGGDGAVVFAAPRGGKQTLCAVASLPAEVAGPDEAAEFVGRLRKATTEHFRPMRLPKRLATYTVLVGTRDQCRSLRQDKGRLIDTGGWHVNVLLGTVLVDLDEFRLHADTTWGLVDTGDHFEQIRRAVAAWCGRRRSPPRAALTGKRHVA